MKSAHHPPPSITLSPYAQTTQESPRADELMTMKNQPFEKEESHLTSPIADLLAKGLNAINLSDSSKKLQNQGWCSANTSFQKMASVSGISTPAPSEGVRCRADQDNEEDDEISGLDQIVISIDNMDFRRGQIEDVDLTVKRDTYIGAHSRSSKTRGSTEEEVGIDQEHKAKLNQSQIQYQLSIRDEDSVMSRPLASDDGDEDFCDMVEVVNEFSERERPRACTDNVPKKPHLMPVCGSPVIENHFHSRPKQIPGLARFSVACMLSSNDNIKTVKAERVKSPTELKSYEGFLDKKAHQWMLGWQRRKVVIGDRKLKYYKKDTKGINKGQFTKLRGVIDFNLLSCRLMVQNGAKPTRFQISILANKRSFHFRCKNYEELRTWVRVIHQEISKSTGDKTDLTKVAIQKKFWRVSLALIDQFNRCTERQFQKVATTGDILLFQGRSFSSKFQRAITRSQYDHVALLLKYKNGKLCLFEATGQNGVDICEWTDFIKYKWHLLYPYLVWRKLNNFERRPEILKSLDAFVKNSKGKKYKITTRKLMKKKCETDYGEQVEDKRNFFCSELVASSFKLMGLLPKKVSSTQYWPGSFAARRGLKLQGGAYFGEETLIDFSL